MKNYFLLFTFAWLFFTNCYSYNNISNEEPTITQPSKTYELRLINKDKISVRNLRMESQNYFYTDRKNREKSIPKLSVLEIKEKEFSWVQTVGLVCWFCGCGIFFRWRCCEQL